MIQNLKEENIIGTKHSKVIRGPYQMSVDITNRCNLRCLHCYNFSGDNCVVEDEMTDEEFLVLIDDIVSLKPLNVCICGGEPLLRKDLLLESIRRLAKGKVSISLVSNGLLLDLKTAKELKEAGINQVQISLDGMKIAHEKLRVKEGSFDSAIQSIKNLTSVKIITGVAFAPTKWNVDDIEEVFELIKGFGVTEMRLQYLMEIGRGNENKNSIAPTNDQYRKLLRKITLIKRKCEKFDYQTSVDWGDPIDHLIRFSEDAFACCTYFSIKANGCIVPSMYLPISVGNVRKNKLSKYWEHGLSRVWNIEFLRDIASEIRSISEMNCYEVRNLPVTFKENDIEIDILSEEYFKELN